MVVQLLLVRYLVEFAPCWREWERRVKGYDSCYVAPLSLGLRARLIMRTSGACGESLGGSVRLRGRAEKVPQDWDEGVGAKEDVCRDYLTR